MHEAFWHEALVYDGEEDFLDRTARFISGALEAGEPTLVMVEPRKIDLLRARLGDEGSAVDFADVSEIGVNPARMIPVWMKFARAYPGRSLRGVSEPAWGRLTSAEIVECQRHESLLNLAFAGSRGFRLLCPYDSRTLAPEIIEEARRSHPYVSEGSAARASPAYRGLDEIAEPFAAPLSEPPAEALQIEFDANRLRGTRAFVARNARGAGLSAERVDALVIAVNEVGANSTRHGGGRGRLLLWLEGDALICEVRDEGVFDAPLAGRELPSRDGLNGRGLWLANQLCDLVQIRSSAEGTIVRLHMRRHS